MALDEPKENDEVIELEGFNVAADKDLIKDTGGINVDFATGPFRKGFQIKGKNSAAFGC